MTLQPNRCALLPSGFLRGNGCYSLAAISVKPAAVAAAAAAIAGLPHGLVPDDPDGYGHVGHFSRDFKACFGMIPSLARRV